MSIDWISAPISEEFPAGADLAAEDDAAFDEYFYDSAGRLPEELDFFRPGMEVGGKKSPDIFFDPKSVDLNEELTQIDALLKRSKDIRLLTLRAQWSILAGDLENCVASVEGMATVLKDFPDTAYPLIDGGPADRLEQINDLSANGPMILPLQYLELANSGASLRSFRVAKGEARPNDGEEDLILDQLIRSLAGAGEDLEKVDDRMRRFKTALTDITSACLGNSTPHTPKVKTLSGEIDAILAVLAEANPSLTKIDDVEDSSTGADTNAAPSTGAGGAKVFVKPATDVKDHADAKKRLIAVETYFGQNEPSSATVLLVTQARLLIGKSLIDAFDVLMPNSSPRAVVNFSPATDFKLAHAQLRTLANEVEIEESLLPPAIEEVVQVEEVEEQSAVAEDMEDAIEATDAEQASEPPAKTAEPAEPANHIVSNPAEATAQIQVVETYFRAFEKSSPVPLLLSRARTYIGKDFETLMKELIPKEDY
jgi:type VI secretion system protein ImpA